MPLTIDRLIRHASAGPATAGADIAERRLRDAAFQLERRRFLGETDGAAIASVAGSIGDHA